MTEHDIVGELRAWRASVTAMDDNRYRLIDEAAAEIERLRAALKPFADCYDLGSVQCDMPDERMLMFASEGGGTYLGFASVRDLRHASDVLRGVERQSGNKS